MIFQVQQQKEIIKNLTLKCDFLKRKARSLNKRRDQTIALCSDIIKHLKERKFINVEESLTYNTCLPHTGTLSKWYQHMDAEPGFAKEAFNTLNRKVKETGHPIICALTLDEMSFRKYLTWNLKVQKWSYWS